ncbi:MAG: DUF5615 family PIN-like protein [Acidimicrobiia bacterium]
MRFLVDQCLSPNFAVLLAEAGHDVVHVRELGMQRAGDPEVLDLARRDDRVLVSADTDFSTLLAQAGATRPSVVIFRRPTGRRPEAPYRQPASDGGGARGGQRGRPRGDPSTAASSTDRRMRDQ